MDYLQILQRSRAIFVHIKSKCRRCQTSTLVLNVPFKSEVNRYKDTPEKNGNDAHTKKPQKRQQQQTTTVNLDNATVFVIIKLLVYCRFHAVQAKSRLGIMPTEQRMTTDDPD